MLLFQFVTDRVGLGGGYQYRVCLHFQACLIKRSLKFAFSVAQIIFGYDDSFKLLRDAGLGAGNLYLCFITGSNESTGLLKQSLSQVILLLSDIKFFSCCIKPPVHTVHSSNNPYYFEFSSGIGYLSLIFRDTNGVSIGTIAGTLQ